MRILLTADPELPVPPQLYGGIERVVDLLARGLRRQGHKVALVAHPDSECAVDTRYCWSGMRSQCIRSSIRNSYTLTAAVAEFRPDVLHNFSRLMYMLPVMRSKLPKIMSYQRDPNHKTVRWSHWLSRGTLTFTGCSRDICSRGRPAGGRWFTIHNCVELDKYTFQEQVAEDAPLVFLSRIEQIKGAHRAIELARRTGRRLLLAGNHSDSGEEGKYWNDEIRPQIGRNGIEYVGQVDDAQKSELLGKAAALVVPIEWDEPFGIVFAEALACGTPVISSPRGALPEIVEHGTHGFLVKSTEEGCDAVAKLGSIDRQACRDRVELQFSSSVIVNKYVSLYESAVDRHSNQAMESLCKNC